MASFTGANADLDNPPSWLDTPSSLMYSMYRSCWSRHALCASLTLLLWPVITHMARQFFLLFTSTVQSTAFVSSMTSVNSLDRRSCSFINSNGHFSLKSAIHACRSRLHLPEPSHPSFSSSSTSASIIRRILVRCSLSKCWFCRNSSYRFSLDITSTMVPA